MEKQVDSMFQQLRALVASQATLGEELNTIRSSAIRRTVRPQMHPHNLDVSKADSVVYSAPCTADFEEQVLNGLQDLRLSIQAMSKQLQDSHTSPRTNPCPEKASAELLPALPWEELPLTMSPIVRKQPELLSPSRPSPSQPRHALELQDWLGQLRQAVGNLHSTVARAPGSASMNSCGSSVPTWREDTQSLIEVDAHDLSLRVAARPAPLWLNGDFASPRAKLLESVDSHGLESAQA